jgi:hypothetical protein
MHLPLVRRRILQGLGLAPVCCALARWLGGVGLALATLLGGGALLALPQAALAQGVELLTLNTSRSDGALNLEFAVQLTLPRPVEDALRRGVPVYFVAQAELKRNRWYWRDERIARVSRSWRVAYQPLTGNWRVGLGGLNQTYASLPEALLAVTRSAGWRLADLSQLDADGRYYVEFSWKLDTSQLPGPMQFGLTGPGEWAVGVERTLRVD